MDEGSEPDEGAEDAARSAGEEGRSRLTAAQRLWTAFTSPGEVFADIRRRPTWVVIMVLVVTLGVVANLVVMPHVDTEATIRARLGDRADELDEQQIERMVEQGEKFAVIGPIAAAVVGPIAWAVMAGVFFVMLKLVGSDADYQHTLSTTLHAYWPPTVIQLTLMSLLVQRMDAIPQQEIGGIVKGDLAVLLAEDAPAWLDAAARTISVFNVWAVILLVMGFATVGRVSRGRAAVATLVPWGVWLAAKAGGTALFS